MIAKVYYQASFYLKNGKKAIAKLFFYKTKRDGSYVLRVCASTRGDVAWIAKKVLEPEEIHRAFRAISEANPESKVQPYFFTNHSELKLLQIVAEPDVHTIQDERVREFLQQRPAVKRSFSLRRFIFDCSGCKIIFTGPPYKIKDSWGAYFSGIIFPNDDAVNVRVLHQTVHSRFIDYIRDKANIFYIQNRDKIIAEVYGEEIIAEIHGE
jgi:hypothetical protein